MTFWLATAVRSNPFNFVNAHCVTSGYLAYVKNAHCLKLIGLLLTTMALCYQWVSGICQECPLLKLSGLLLTTMASRNGIQAALVWAEKGNHWTKMADLGIILLRRSYLILWYQLLYDPHIFIFSFFHLLVSAIFQIYNFNRKYNEQIKLEISLKVINTPAPQYFLTV